MQKQIDWNRIEARYGDGTFTSIRQIAREFDVTEGAIRKKIKDYYWARDNVRARLTILREFVNAHLNLLEGEVRTRLAATRAPLQNDPGYPPDAQ